MATRPQHLSVPPVFNSESDPCSLIYRKNDPIPRSPKDSKDRARKHRRWKTLTKGFARSIKKVFGSKSKSPFVMPYEYQKLHLAPSRRSSVRSHRSSVMRMAHNRLSAPAVLVTSPSTKSQTGSLYLHSYNGPSSPPAKQDSVRFSHPAVNSVVRPDTPATMLSMYSSHMDIDDRFSIRTSTPSSELTGSNSNNSSDPPPIRPKHVWRESNQFKEFDGTPVSFDEFKARLDGHKIRSGPPIYKRMTAERPPSLQFIPRMSDFTLDENIQVPKSPDVSPVDVQNNRNEALTLLEQGGVLAVLPQQDMPISAVPVLSGQYPAYSTHKRHPQSLIPGGLYRHPPSLTPGSRPDAASADPRPNSYPPKDTPKQAYRAYHPDDYDFFHRATPATAHVTVTPPAPEKKRSSRASRYEGKSVDEVVAEAKARVVSVTGVPFEQSLLTADIGQSPEERRSRAAQLTREKVTHHKAASSTNVNRKPLPPTPQPRTNFPPINVSVPSPHKMNDNGYPVQNLREAASIYVADPKYQRRSINDVEAKYLREHGDTKKKIFVPDEYAGLDKKSIAKLEKAKEKAEKKLAKEQEKIAKKEAEKAAKIAKKEKKKAEALKKRPDLVEKQKQIDESVKKLVFV